MMLRVACLESARSTQHAAYPIDRFTGNSDILGGRVNTAANPMTPQLRGNGDRRILDIETALCIDWVVSGEGALPTGRDRRLVNRSTIIF